MMHTIVTNCTFIIRDLEEQKAELAPLDLRGPEELWALEDCLDNQEIQENL